MTMKIQDTTIKVKVKKHPNEVKYPGRACRDTLFKITEFLDKLTPEQMILFGESTLNWEPEATQADIKSLLPKDQIGLAIQYENGFIPTIMEVESVDPTTQELSGKDVFSKEDLSVTFAEVSVARALGSFEILYRDGKPYGQPEEQELKVRIMQDDGKEAAESSTTPEPVTSVKEPEAETK